MSLCICGLLWVIKKEKRKHFEDNHEQSPYGSPQVPPFLLHVKKLQYLRGCALTAKASLQHQNYRKKVLNGFTLGKYLHASLCILKILPKILKYASN